MRHPIPFLTAACIVLAGCDVSDTVAPDSRQPSMLIAGSPLLSLLNDPLDAELWQWTDARTREVSYAVTIEVMARKDLFGDAADPNMRIVGSSKFLDAAGKAVADVGSKSVSVASLDPVASGTDGYSLVVIAMPLSEGQSRFLDAALAKGSVKIDVVAQLVATAKNGKDDILDGLGALVLADPRPSPIAFPKE
jgi:hypothetical protein